MSALPWSAMEHIIACYRKGTHHSIGMDSDGLIFAGGGLDQEPGKDKWDMIPLELPKLKECFCRWQQELHGKGWNSLFFNNHFATDRFPVGR